MANWEAPVTNGFSLIQITDTQYLSESNPALYNTLTSCIVNNTNALNVSMVIHTGDIVNVANSPAQWSNANDAMMTLYNNGIPYCWDAGNHDQLNSTAQGGGGDPNGAWLGGYYPAFNVTLMQQEPYWVSSIFDGANTAVRFSFGSHQFMVINIEYDANQTVLNWMETLITANPTINVIVATHNFLNGDGGYGYTLVSASGEWAANFENILNNYPNVILTLNGHDVNDGGTAYNRKVGNREEIFFNRQEVDGKTGGAAARIYTFNMSNPAQPVVNVYTYQAYSNGAEGPQYLTDPLDQFSFSVNLSAYSPQTVNFTGGTDFLGEAATA
ncbi:MAG: metallophosphoesterase [Candidatus Bathyarchaeia archaeon]